MGMLLVLLSPRQGRTSPRRATRAQRREARRVEGEEWAAAEACGHLLDLEHDDLQALRDRAGGCRLPVFVDLDPWADAVVTRQDLPQLEADVDRLYAAVGPDSPQREVVAAIRALLVRWRAEPDLVLHCYGD
jgi:hypothetical protein